MLSLLTIREELANNVDVTQMSSITSHKGLFNQDETNFGTDTIYSTAPLASL